MELAVRDGTLTINLIHRRRIEFGLTQEQLAAKVIERGGSLRQEHIARIETGAVVPRIDTLVAISQVGRNIWH